MIMTWANQTWKAKWTKAEHQVWKEKKNESSWSRLTLPNDNFTKAPYKSSRPSFNQLKMPTFNSPSKTNKPTSRKKNKRKKSLKPPPPLLFLLQL